MIFLVYNSYGLVYLSLGSPPSRLRKEIGRQLLAARDNAGVTQTQLAKRMKTTQPVIARLESGRELPSTRTLARFAAAIGRRLVIEFRNEESATPRGNDDRHQ